MLSEGRLVLGAGVGSDESGDFSSFGVPTDVSTRAAMLSEGLGLMRAMWAGKAIQQGGFHYQVHVAATEPEPHRIPVWLASSTNNPHVISRAADGDGIFRYRGQPRVAKLGVLLGRPGLVAVRRSRSANAGLAGATDVRRGRVVVVPRGTQRQEQ
jgi:alkanesulfonate monooxygenase SsuD/methylene tetrahydromethanopterin reductase-like flavin-dependent oxidoreductase (luciferase family)